MSASEQYNTQRELARMNRSRHGADMTLDRAEIRQDAMIDWLYAARYLLPLIVTALLAGIGPASSTTWMAGMSIVCTALFLGKIVGRMLDTLAGAFHDNLQFKTENLFFKLAAILLAAIGVGSASPGVAICGVALFFFPERWKRFGQKVIHNSDFERLMREQRAANAIQPIIE